MEPQLPKPQLPNIEQAPIAPIEQTPNSFENGVLQEAIEKNLVNPEQDIAQASPPQTQQVAVDDQATLAIQAPVSQQSYDPTTQTNTPVVAADEDVIEKEWVDKAKQIVAKNKDDPRMQKHEVSNLQADYIKKRYGKIVKVPDES